MSSAGLAGLRLMIFNYPDVGIVESDEQPYVAVVGTVTMSSFAPVADRLPGLLDWAWKSGLARPSPPFFRYRVIDMDAGLLIEAGVPVVEPYVPTDDAVVAGVLPAGRFVTTTYVGPPEDLVAVNGGLQDWGAALGVRWDRTFSDAGEVWGCRLEWLETDPRTEPDPRRWRTRLAYRLADD